MKEKNHTISPKTSLPAPCTQLGASNARKIKGNLNKPALITNPDLLVKLPTCNNNIRPTSAGFLPPAVTASFQLLSSSAQASRGKYHLKASPRSSAKPRENTYSTHPIQSITVGLWWPTWCGGRGIEAVLVSFLRWRNNFFSQCQFACTYLWNTEFSLQLLRSQCYRSGNTWFTLS